MGTTLTNNVYLPDEGERNCYSGLANNWQILDNAVGAIAGKANASHTHGNITNNGAIGSTSGLPIITGTDGVLTTGSFGNTAGTFCEGNDSRLSDARTPVAHTHVTADVTDLLSVNHTWTGTQRFTSSYTRQEGTTNTHGYVIKADFARGSAPSATANLTFRWLDSNDNIMGYLDFVATSAIYATRLNLRTENNGTQVSESIQLETDLTGSYFSFKPLSNGNIDLGASSYQWNNLYAKNYFYNGTQWGLDQANTWTANQTFKGNIQQYFDAASNTTPATNQFNVYNTVGSNSGVIVSQQTANRTTGQRDVSTIVYATDNTFNGYQLVKDANNNYWFGPIYTNTVALGTLSLQWKSVSSQTYYYNGTAWGLDQANVWTGLNTYSAGLMLRGSRNGYILPEQAASYSGLTLSTPEFKQSVKIGDWVDNSGTISFNTSNAFLEIYAGLDSADSVNKIRVTPRNATESELGASSNKWKNLWANGINSIPTDTVEWHNSHYRGENLVSSGHFANMAALLTAIRNQDWSDIYIGDYVELTFTYEGASRTVKFYVGEIDKFYKVGNASLETHHLVMVTGDLGINQVMNDSNTTAGGYVGSKAHTTTLPALYEIINPLFNNAILTHREHLSNTVASTQSVNLTLNDTAYTCSNFPIFSSGDPNTAGAVTAGAWYDCNLVLMSEIEMFGSNRFSSSGIDDIMTPEGQIAVFKYNRSLQTLNRTVNTWLRNVNSASRFCNCHYFGRSLRYNATNTTLRLRPRFLIG